MKLPEKQALFAVLLARLILWIDSQGWAVTLADIGVSQQRKVRTPAGKVIVAQDCEHMRQSLHYQRLAADLNLFVGGKWITDGAAKEWLEIGEYWEGMNELCRWGGRFLRPDSNHFSVTSGGRS